MYPEKTERLTIWNGGTTRFWLFLFWYDLSLKIKQVREYIDDTEDYVNIQLDNQRNELIQLQLALTIVSFGIAANTFIAGAFAMNIPSSLYNITDGSLFWPFVGGTSSTCFVITILLFWYAWWKKLLGSWAQSKGKMAESLVMFAERKQAFWGY